jgi:hypothetical protein
MTAPLEDPTYVPVHQPARGRVPDVVIRWGQRSQLGWFKRFWHELEDQRDELPWVPSRIDPGLFEREGESEWTPLSEYWCESEHHKGPCCYSCHEEFWEHSTGVQMDGWCCCRDERTKHR